MMSLVLQRIRRWARVHRLGGGGVWAFMELRGTTANTKDGNVGRMSHKLYNQSIQ